MFPYWAKKLWKTGVAITRGADVARKDPRHRTGSDGGFGRPRNVASSSATTDNPPAGSPDLPAHAVTLARPDTDRAWPAFSVANRSPSCPKAISEHQTVLLSPESALSLAVQ